MSVQPQFTDPAPDAVVRLRTLEQEFSDRQTGRGHGRTWRPALTRTLKIVLGIGMLGAFGVVPARIMLQPGSVEAVINRRVIVLRAPIDGILEGALLDASGPLRIANSRADAGRVSEMTARLSRAAAQRDAAASRLKEQEEALARLENQGENFRRGRIAQLTARNADLTALAVVATARRDEARRAHDRAAALAKSGSVSVAELDRLARDRTVADQLAISAQQQLEAAAVELAAARSGVFVGDSYNDRPSSLQGADDARRRIAELRAEGAVAAAEMSVLAREAEEEAARAAQRAKAELIPPAGSRLWEALATPGEQVRAGQDLGRYLDCEKTLVTAAVTEAVYNQLTLGQRARFVSSDGGPDLGGRVIDLTGSAGVAGNLAIPPSAFGHRAAYRVNVELDDAGQGCSVGRTGRVLFGRDA